MSVPETAVEKDNFLTKEAKTFETLPFEYHWPQDNAGEYYLVERHVCEFLKDDSLLQKYPEIHYHEASNEEKKLLFEQEAITEAEFHEEEKKVLCLHCTVKDIFVQIFCTAQIGTYEYIKPVFFKCC